jgi:tRNA-specific 2-thiouridylase
MESPGMKKRVLVGMSGGVDSSAAAALLLSQGYDVHGITMRIWKGEASSSETRTHACYGPGEEEDIEDARKVAQQLKIPFTVIGLEEEYHSCVITYFKDEYLRGRTPNPCVRCNHRMKFGLLLDRAKAQGLDFDFFATGHYAIKYRDQSTGRWSLRKALDRSKDQTYFLAFLEQHQLEGSLFPLGEMKKNEVRVYAESLHLPVTAKPESQDFIDSGDYGTLFDGPQEEGPILDLEGKKLGTHRGIIHYTVGQRKGLGISAKEPLYVIRIDMPGNALIVGPDSGLFSVSLTASSLNWVAIEKLGAPMKARARIRLSHKEAPALIEPEAHGMVRVTFDEAQRGATPGQAIVFYEKDLLLGGGIIEQVLDETKEK